MSKVQICIEAPARVLVVEDFQDRVDCLVRDGIIKTEFTHARNALQALDFLDERWDVIFLDHDLETYIQDPYKREINGTDIARYMATLDWRPSRVIIHSMNPTGAKNMEQILEDADFSVLRIPITAISSWVPWKIKC